MSGTILIHTCCAPCAAPSLETVRQDEWNGMVLFFSNSNIYPQAEYDLRLDQVRRLAEISQVRLVEDDYDHGGWLDAVKGFEDEPEKGERCRRCFEFNLRRTAAAAERLDLTSFTTTLSVSPHKDCGVIAGIGSAWSGFVLYDFKKNDGFRRGIEWCRQYQFYRQNYCGCEFSLRARDLRQQRSIEK